MNNQVVKITLSFVLFFPLLFTENSRAYVPSIYYIDNTCIMNGTGTAPTCAASPGQSGPYNSIGQMQEKSSGYSEGDKILFKRGTSYQEGLTPLFSGTYAHPIIYDVYGTSSEGEVEIKGGLHISNRNNLIFNRLIFSSKNNSIVSSTNIIFNYCILKNNSLYGIWSESSTVQVNNCVIANNAANGIYSYGQSSVVTIRNSIIIGNGGFSYYGLDTGNGGIINYDYSIVTGNNWLPNSNISSIGITDGGHNLKEYDPGITAYAAPKALFNITLDDTDLGYFLQVASALNPLGVKITVFVDPGWITTTQQLADLKTLANEGNEVGIHGWSHSNLAATHAFTVTTTNANPSITIDTARKELILETTTPGKSVTVGWAINLKTIGDLKIATEQKDWTITNDSTNIHDFLKLSSLKDTAGAQTSFPYDAALDISAPTYAYWNDEIVETQKWIASVTGVTPVTMAYPNGLTSPALEAWLRDHTSLIGARGTSGPTYNLSNLDIYNIKTNNSDLGSTEAVSKANARHIAVFTKTTGSIYEMYSHYDTQVTPQQWVSYVDEIMKTGGVFSTFKDAVADIRSDHITTDGLTYSKSYIDVSSYKLLPGSPAINAGIDSPLTSDILGNPIIGSPDIGAYEFQGVSTSKDSGALVFGIANEGAFFLIIMGILIIVTIFIIAKAKRKIN